MNTIKNELIALTKERLTLNTVEYINLKHVVVKSIKTALHKLKPSAIIEIDIADEVIAEYYVTELMKDIDVKYSYDKYFKKLTVELSEIYAEAVNKHE